MLQVLTHDVSLCHVKVCHTSDYDILDMILYAMKKNTPSWVGGGDGIRKRKFKVQIIFSHLN